VLILEALGYVVPRYAHLALVLGEDRSKLSKRHGATSVNQFKNEGFLPAAMINYLCNLGWNDGTEQEIYTVDELVQKFSLDRVTKSPAVFDMKKLRWINGQHLRSLPPATLEGLVRERLAEEGVWSEAVDGEVVATASAMVAEKLELVNDAVPLVREALGYPLADTLASDGAKAFVADGSVAEVGAAVVAAFQAGELPDPAADGFADAWGKWVKATGKALGRKGKGLFMPLRIVATGRMAGPDVPAQLRLVGLADAGVLTETVPFAERMAALEAAIASLPMPEPAAAA